MPDVLRVLAVLPPVELGRALLGPKPLLEQLRARSERAAPRTLAQRQRLRAAIHWIDARLPGGGNCYRRALVEIALDRDAAREPLVMSFKSSGTPRSGHAWLSSAPDAASRLSYDAEIDL